MPIPRGQLTSRTSAVADRYLKAIVDDSKHSHPVSPDSTWNKEAHLSLSGTASLSSSSRTPTPVRAQSRAAWQTRSIATSPRSPPDPEESTRSRIRLFPATAPTNEEDTTDGSSFMTPHTTETRSTGTQRKKSPDSTCRPVAVPFTESNHAWRKRLEGTSRGMKTSPSRHVLDSHWIKKKGSPRRLGANPRGFKKELPPQSLTALTINSQLKRSDPSSAPTEVMMNLSSARRELDQKSDFGGAPTEVATNCVADRLTGNSEAATNNFNRRFDRNRTAAHETQNGNEILDEDVAYPLDQQWRESQSYVEHKQEENKSKNQNSVERARNQELESGAGRLGYHVYDFPPHGFVSSDASFQSKSLSSSVGVETGGRSTVKSPTAVRRVLETSAITKGIPGESRMSHSGTQQHSGCTSIHPEMKKTVTQASENIVDVSYRRDFRVRQSGGVANTVGSISGEHGVDTIHGTCIHDERLDNPFVVQIPGRRYANVDENSTMPDSPASSGWTPVVLSSTGVEQEEFQVGLLRSGEKTVQLLFSPDRVNHHVIDMVEFGPPKINRTTLVADETTSAMVGPKFLQSKDSTTLNERADTNDRSLSVESHFNKLSENNLALVPPPMTYIQSTVPLSSKSVPINLRKPEESTHEKCESETGKVHSLVRSRIQAFSNNDVNARQQIAPAAEPVGQTDCPVSVRSNVEDSKSESWYSTSWLKASSRTDLSAIPSNCTSREESTRTRRLSNISPPPKPVSVARAEGHGGEWDKCHSLTETSFHEKSLNVNGSLGDPPMYNQSTGKILHDENRDIDSKISDNAATARKRNGTNKGDRVNSFMTENDSRLVGKTSFSSSIPLSSNVHHRVMTIRGDETDKTVPNRISPVSENRNRKSSPISSPNKDSNHSSPVVGSVSMMRSIFESQHGDSAMQHDDDEMTNESVDVKSIRSMFEELQEKPIKQEIEKSENAVTKIRSMFERNSLRPHNEKTKVAVRNLEMNLRKNHKPVRPLGKKPPETKAERVLPNRSKQLSLEGEGSPKIDLPAVQSTANNNVAKSDLQATYQPTIAERIHAMKLERTQPGGNDEERLAQGCVSPPGISASKLVSNNNGFRIVAQSGGSKNGRATHEDRKQFSRGGQHSLGKATTNERAHTSNDTPHARQGNNSLVNSGRTVDVPTVNADTIVGVLDPSVYPISTGDKKLDSKWGQSVVGVSDVSPRQSKVYSSSLQGVMVRKPMKEEGVHENRTDSEGYDDGVTLDLSIADVSCLTNPTFLQSKEDASLDGASSRVSKDIVDGRGPSEASSSQTSEAAAPLLALSMRTKFTNSSDDFGSFSQRSFSDRLSPGQQSKWIPLTKPIDENLGGAEESNGEMADLAWDLRNIKARFAERQAKKANKGASRMGAEFTLKKQSDGNAEIDRWEPFEPFQFPETSISFEVKNQKAGRIDDHRQSGDVLIESKTFLRAADSRGPVNNNDSSAFCQMYSEKVQKRAHNSPIDPPSTGSPKLKISNRDDNLSTVANQRKPGPPVRSTENPEPYSKHTALMSKLLSLREARMRRNNAFSRKAPLFRSSQMGSQRSVSGIAPTKQSQFRTQSNQLYVTSHTGMRPEDEEQSASTLSSTRFGGHKFVDCLDVD